MPGDENRIILLDGSFGSQLSKYVEKSIDGDPLWSARALVTDPEAVRKVHLDFIKAGCDIIETNTYQASIPGFVKYLDCSKEEAYNLIKSAVQLAKDAISQAEAEGWLQDGKKPLIAGSVGPYGAHLHDGSEYKGYDNDAEVFREYHKPRVAALLEAGVDLLAIETIPSAKEAKVLVELLQNYPDIKAWLSFSCQPDSKCTASGDNFQQTVIDCYSANPNQIMAVGVNCIAPHAVENLIKDVQDLPLIVYANSGENYDRKSGWDNNCEKLEEYVPLWLDLGVKYIGGCCRITDDYLKKIMEKVREWEKRQVKN